jgi:hypothetical protein
MPTLLLLSKRPTPPPPTVSKPQCESLSTVHRLQNFSAILTQLSRIWLIGKDTLNDVKLTTHNNKNCLPHLMRTAGIFLQGRHRPTYHQIGCHWSGSACCHRSSWVGCHWSSRVGCHWSSHVGCHWSNGRQGNPPSWIARTAPDRLAAALK